jgi:prefoldin subunit 5
MWWKSPHLDRIEANIERLAEISEVTNLRLDRFVEATNQKLQQMRQEIQGMAQRTEQLQRAMEYLLGKDG